LKHLEGEASALLNKRNKPQTRTDETKERDCVH
jgi:hypothetical protein